MIALLALPLTLLSLQQPAGASIAQRLAGRVSPELASLVVQLGTAASARGLPIDPLMEKAIEGSAKGVPAERVATAVRLVAMQLDTAAAAPGRARAPHTRRGPPPLHPTHPPHPPAPPHP